MSEAMLADAVREHLAIRAQYVASLQVLPGWLHLTDEHIGTMIADAYLRGHDDRQSVIDALAAEVEKWKGQYYDVADAVARESTGVVDLCRKARQTRENCDVLTARVRELETQIAAQPQPAAVGVMGYGITDGRLIGPWIDHTRERAEQRLRVSSSYTNVVAILNADIIAQPAQEREG